MKRLQTNKPKIDNNNDQATNSRRKTMKSNAAKTLKISSLNAPSFMSLEASMNDKSLQVYRDDHFVCIKDKYPKSRFHLLLIPLTNPKLTKVQDLIKLENAIDLLKKLKTLSEKIAQENRSSEIKEINYGFHSIQSMHPLHMHIISNDFQSECLKNKKHWNSFTSPYFIHLNDLIKHLETDKDYKNDVFNLNNTSKLEDYLKMDLVCHVCKQAQTNMPNLKKHIQTH